MKISLLGLGLFSSGNGGEDLEPIAGFLLLENGDFLLLEDGTSKVALEGS